MISLSKGLGGGNGNQGNQVPFLSRSAGARPRSRARKSDLDRLCDSPSRAPSALPDRLVKSPTFVSEKTYKPYNSKRPSTSRTYLSSISNHVDLELRDPGVKVKPEKSSLMDQEPAFIDVTKDVPGLTVWRLEVNYWFPWPRIVQYYWNAVGRRLFCKFCY